MKGRSFGVNNNTMQMAIPDPYPEFRYLRPLIRFAGIIGLLQSIIWIGMAITGITAYYCVLAKFNETDTRLGSITQQTFQHMYFGECSQSTGQTIDFTAVDKVGRTLSPHNVNIWMWIYLGVNILWLISSSTLLRNINKYRLALLNAILLIWVVITLALSAMDLALAILFGLEYGDLVAIAYKTDIISASSAVILAAVTSSISMMIVSVRGFILWIINVILLSYLFVHTFLLSKVTTESLSGQDNEGFASETHSEILRQPIAAYSNVNGGNHNSLPAKLNVEPLKRATVMSIDTLLHRHYQRYPPGNDYYTIKNLSKSNDFSVLAENNTFKPHPNVPDPDYSPQMVRSNTASTNQSNRPLKSALRNSRYQ